MDDLPGLGVHAEGAQGVRQALGVVPQLRAHLGVVAAPVLLQQGDGRVAVCLLALRQLLLDGVADLLRRRLHLLLQLGLFLLVAEGLFRRRCFRRGCRLLAADGRGRRYRRAQHLIRRAHVLAAPGEEGTGGRDDRAVVLPVQRNVDAGALLPLRRRLFLRYRGGCRGEILRHIVKVVVLVPAQALAVAADALRRLLGRHVQRAQQRRQKQHHEHDDGYHLTQQRLAAHGQTAGHHAAAAQRLTVRPQLTGQTAAEFIRGAAQRQMAQHADQQRQHRHAHRTQDHRPSLVPQLDHRHRRQCRRRQVIAPAQCAPQHAGDPCQQQGVHIKIAHQHAQRQQRAHDAAHQPRGGVVRRRRRRCRCFFASVSFLLCRCHSLPHLMPCRTRVSTPTAQQ